MVWFVSVVVILGVLFDRTGFGLVWFGLVCYIGSVYWFIIMNSMRIRQVIGSVTGSPCREI